MVLPNIFVNYSSVTSLIGNTPILDISYFSSNPRVKIFAKMENVNPSGSYKDRIALSMIEGAEKEGILKKEIKIIEPTSGNTGIALSLISTMKGYDFTAVMPSSMSEERRKMIKAFGGNLILKKGTESKIIKYTKKLAKEKSYYMPDQFENKNNLKAAYQLGKEISLQIKPIDKFIAGIGTGGTISGVGKKLKEVNKKIEIIGFYSPDEKIQGTINLGNFLPKNLKKKFVDKIYPVEEKIALKNMKNLWRNGIFVGLSSGAALEIAIKESKKMKKGNIIMVFADSGNRYLSLVRNKKAN